MNLSQGLHILSNPIIAVVNEESYGSSNTVDMASFTGTRSPPSFTIFGGLGYHSYCYVGAQEELELDPHP